MHQLIQLEVIYDYQLLYIVKARLIEPIDRAKRMAINIFAYSNVECSLDKICNECKNHLPSISQQIFDQKL